MFCECFVNNDADVLCRCLPTSHKKNLLVTMNERHTNEQTGMVHNTEAPNVAKISSPMPTIGNWVSFQMSLHPFLLTVDPMISLQPEYLLP